MLEQLIGMAASQLAPQLQNHPELQGQNIDLNNITQAAGGSIFETIANQLGSGNTGGLTEMISGQETDMNHPAAQEIQGSVISDLIQKSGISPEMAATIASAAIPIVMNMLNKQSSQAQEGGVDMGSLITGALAGGGQQGGGGLLGNIVGGMLGGGQSQGGGMGGQILTSVLGQLMK